MSPEELVLRAHSQLNGGSPEFPCIETCHAIIALGSMLDSAKEELAKATKREESARRGQQSFADKASELERDIENVKKEADNYKFLNSVAFSFIRDLAENEYDGKEAVTAQRIFGLHKEDLGIKLMRCHKLNSAEEAKVKFSEWCQRNGVEATDKRMVEWLLSVV